MEASRLRVILMEALSASIKWWIATGALYAFFVLANDQSASTGLEKATFTMSVLLRHY